MNTACACPYPLVLGDWLCYPCFPCLSSRFGYPLIIISVTHFSHGPLVPMPVPVRAFLQCLLLSAEGRTMCISQLRPDVHRNRVAPTLCLAC